MLFALLLAPTWSTTGTQDRPKNSHLRLACAWSSFKAARPAAAAAGRPRKTTGTATTPQTQALCSAKTSPSPWTWTTAPGALQRGSKRRRLNADDGDDARRQDALLQEDEAGVHAPALRPSAASAQPASVLAVYAHNASRFDCTLCVYTAGSFAALKRHRDSRHRRTAFLDKFSAGCACGTPFDSRLAAARHAPACASLSST
ncbi:hypothetical protein PC111_g24605, partial [Phytophthora cactorum]